MTDASPPLSPPDDRLPLDGKHVLLSCFAIDPTEGSEPYVGWNWTTVVYAGVRRTVLTRELHRPILEAQDVPLADFAYFDLPFCSRLGHRHPAMKLYYILWQICVLPYAFHLCLKRGITAVHHITYNTLDFPGFLWLIPRIRFIWGPVGGGQVPPVGFMSYYGRDRANQLRRSAVKRLSWANPLIRGALRRASLVLAANTDTHRLLAGITPHPGRLHRVLETAVHEAGKSRTLRPGAGKAGDPIRIIWVGRFEPRKAPRLALQTARRAEQVAPGRFRLTMIGAGPLWHETVTDASRDAIVTILPPVDFLEMETVYREADILLFTSLQDTSGNVVLEAMARGLPVVAFDHQGTADILAGGGGCLTPPTTPEEAIESFCAGLLTLAEPENYARISTEAIESIRRAYLWTSKRRAVARLLAPDEAVMAVSKHLAPPATPSGLGTAR